MSLRPILLVALLLMSLIPCVAEAQVQVPILLYHRFGTTVPDSMTITDSNFEGHLKYLKENGYKVIPLSQLVDYVRGKGPEPAAKSVVICADDGHKSVYSDMLPLVKKYNIPVTLFIYPSAISNAKYAMTWDQLRALQSTGLFTIESHTFWHPDFRKEKKRLAPAEYTKFVDMQLKKSKARLEKEMGRPVEYLAWPFGISGDELFVAAGKAGYLATFTIVAKPVKKGDDPMRLPRFLLPNGSAKTIANIVPANTVAKAK
jgi:peptidoglycan/xylan/chitin deacetylase (PgdA/CDA1 family)